MDAVFVARQASCIVSLAYDRRRRMSYRVRFSLFLLAAVAVASLLGYFTSFLGPWVSVLVVVVTIPLTIEIGRKVLKRDRL